MCFNIRTACRLSFSKSQASVTSRMKEGAPLGQFHWTTPAPCQWESLGCCPPEGTVLRKVPLVPAGGRTLQRSAHCRQDAMGTCRSLAGTAAH